MVAGIGLVEQRKPGGVGLPIKGPAVEDDAADRGAVSADVLGGRVDHDRRPMVERPADDRRGGVVDDQRNAQVLAQCGHLGDRKDRQFRVGQGFGIEGAGFVIHRPPEIIRIGGVDKADFDALLTQCVGEEIPGAAIEVGRADDVVTGLGDVLNGQGRGGLPGRHRQTGGPAFQGRQALFENIAGRVHDPAVDVAQFLERKKICRLLGVLELKAGGLMDRHRNRTGGGIRPVAGVKRQGLRVARWGGHGLSFPSKR